MGWNTLLIAEDASTSWMVVTAPSRQRPGLPEAAAWRDLLRDRRDVNRAPRRWPVQIDPLRPVKMASGTAETSGVDRRSST